MGYVIDLAGNVCGLAEEIVGFVFERWPRLEGINDGVYGNVGCIPLLGPAERAMLSSGFATQTLFAIVALPASDL